MTVPTARVTADGRRAFVKAVSSLQNANSPDPHRREALVAVALPASVPAPRLLGSYDDGTWVALVDIEGHHPTTPWKTDELSVVLLALATLATTLTPPPPRTVLALLHACAATFDADVADLVAVLAGVGGYFADASRKAPPPGLPTLRDFQRAQGDAVLSWLRELR